MRRLILLSALALSLTACGSETSEDRQTTETRMDDLDSLEGTISDDAINTDRSTEEGPIEAAPITPSATDAQRPKASEEKGGPVVVPTAPEPDDKAETE